MNHSVELLVAERARQVSEEGYSAYHDKGHGGELAMAASAYALAASDDLGSLHYVANSPEFGTWDWPWDESYWKPTGNAERDLVKAGALILAALDSIGGQNG